MEVDVVRKAIRNIHLAVLPPDGRIRVATPPHVADEQIRRLIIGRLGWIRAQQAKFEQQPRQTVRRYVSGETHFYQGRPYRLQVHEREAAPTIRQRGGQFIDLYTRPGSSIEQRQQTMQTWYREQLKAQIPALLAKWEPIVGERATTWAVKLMKTEWGTCTIEARRIWLNLELAKVPAHLLEYVVVHELTHLLERQHNAHFKELLDQFMPHWRTYRAELNDGMLAAFEDYGGAE